MELDKEAYVAKVSALSEGIMDAIKQRDEFCETGGMFDAYKKDVHDIFDEVKKLERSAMQTTIVARFNIICGRANVSEKQTFCHVDGGDRIVVVGKYGLAMQKTRGEAARKVKDWHEFRMLYTDREKIVASLKASSLQGVLELAKKFELFMEIINSTGFMKMPMKVYGEVPLVRSMQLPKMRMDGTRDRGATVVSLCAYYSWNDLEFGCRDEQSLKYREGNEKEWTEDGMIRIAKDVQGMFMLCAMDKEWKYYVVKLREQVRERYGASKRVLELTEEAFGGDLMVASL